jgi:glycosyltransferase involved in cell wall biosynthesis
VPRAGSSPPPALADYAAEPGAGVPGGGRRFSAGPSAAAAPEVSIVTAVRNGAATVDRALDSVRAQDAAGIEHVVVDGASTDGTVDALRARGDDIALWISEPDRGISDGFNKGIALSRGKIVGILNSDDWYEPGAVSAVLAAMRASGAQIACGSLQYWERGRRTYLARSDPALLARAMHVGHPTVFVRRDTYRRLGLFRLDFRLAMDYEWLLRASTSGVAFVTLDRCIANMHGGGVGDRRWRDSQREVARARALHIPAADSAWAYNTYVARAIVRGLVRRGLDAAGLGVVRAYHRYASPVKVTSEERGSKG